MTPKEFDAMRRAWQAVNAADDPKGRVPFDSSRFDLAKKIVPCHRCGVMTANPVRMWENGITLVDYCNPCVAAVKRK